MFDYFYARENEQYLFLQMPWMLIKDDQFKSLSDSAKILYSLLVNRTSLSAKNGWVDEQGRVYIIYTQEEIMSDLNCWEKKATKSLKELREIGLIKSVRQGLGKPNIIYVMNFATNLKYQLKGHEEPTNPMNTQKCQKDISRNVKVTYQEMSKGHSINNNDIETDTTYTETTTTRPGKPTLTIPKPEKSVVVVQSTGNEFSTKKGPDAATAPDTFKKLIADNFNIALTEKQARMFDKACDGDVERLNDKIKLLKEQPHQVKNVIGWLLSALEDDYKQSGYINKKPKANGFINYEQREWDYDEIERRALLEMPETETPGQ